MKPYYLHTSKNEDVLFTVEDMLHMFNAFGFNGNLQSFITRDISIQLKMRTFLIQCIQMNEIWTKMADSIQDSVKKESDRRLFGILDYCKKRLPF